MKCLLFPWYNCRVNFTVLSPSSSTESVRPGSTHCGAMILWSKTVIHLFIHFLSLTLSVCDVCLFILLFVVIKSIITNLRGNCSNVIYPQWSQKYYMHDERRRLHLNFYSNWRCTIEIVECGGCSVLFINFLLPLGKRNKYIPFFFFFSTEIILWLIYINVRKIFFFLSPLSSSSFSPILSPCLTQRNT